MILNVLVGAFWFYLHRPSDDGSSRSRPNCLRWPFTLHSPITEKTSISNLNIIHFSCIVSLCHKNLCTHLRQYTVQLFYILLLSEQQCVAGNIITNRTVYCLMNVCSCFVIVLKLFIFSAVTFGWWRWGVVTVWWVATLPMSCYIVREITTMSVPQSYAYGSGYAGYLRTSQSLVGWSVLVALWCCVSSFLFE